MVLAIHTVFRHVGQDMPELKPVETQASAIQTTGEQARSWKQELYAREGWKPTNSFAGGFHKKADRVLMPTSSCS